MGYKIDGSSSETLQASFNAIESEDVKTVLLILAIKPMRRAKYFCAGSFEDPAKYLHFALNIPMYTHFTSPIRRYADVVVHRQLETILKKERKLFNIYSYRFKKIVIMLTTIIFFLLFFILLFSFK